jgi:hypothetical protein
MLFISFSEDCMLFSLCVFDVFSTSLDKFLTAFFNLSENLELAFELLDLELTSPPELLLDIFLSKLSWTLALLPAQSTGSDLVLVLL